MTMNEDSSQRNGRSTGYSTHGNGTHETAETLSQTPTSPAQRPGWFSRILISLGVKSNPHTLRNDLEVALSGDHDDSENSFTPEERAMLTNILRLREVRIEDVMVTRSDIEAVDATISLGDLLKRFNECGHSRMPVYQDTLDAPLGLVHIKDIMSYMTQSGSDEAAQETSEGDKPLMLSCVDLSQTLKDVNLIRQILFVPPSMPANDLLATMQASRIQMALVIDEYGGTDGLVSLEDIVETVVGDIEDEHDDDELPLLQKQDNGVYIADARIELTELAQTLGTSFETAQYDEDIDTLGGLVFTILGRVPARGELINKVPGFEFEVLDVDPRRIKRVRIFPPGSRKDDSRRARRNAITAETQSVSGSAEIESKPETTIENRASNAA
jgi:CBS domain containing-hemolysin-like protein